MNWIEQICTHGQIEKQKWTEAQKDVLFLTYFSMWLPSYRDFPKILLAKIKRENVDTSQEFGEISSNKNSLMKLRKCEIVMLSIAAAFNQLIECSN